VDEFPRDVEGESRAADALCQVRVEPVELFEDPPLLRSRDAGSGVCDFESNYASEIFETDADVGISV
jgi:hypothetical protein